MMPHPTLQQLHEDFMAESRYLARLSPVTLRNYQATFALFNKIVPMAVPALLTSEALTRFFRELDVRERVSPRGRIKRGVKATTIATYRAKLNPFFRWLKLKGYIHSSPFENIPTPRVSYDEPKYLRKEQIEKIFAAVEYSANWSSSFMRKRNKAILMVLLCAGLRKSELLSLKLIDVDLTRGEMKIEAKTSKSKHHRTLPLNGLLRRALEDYLEEKREYPYTTPYLFTADCRDEPLSGQGLKHMLKQIGHASGIRFHAHQLRHTFAVNLISSGSDISVVQKLMGHKSLTSTLTYLRCIPSKTMRHSVEAMSWDSLV